MEPCQSGLTYLFAKEAGASNPLDGSNPSGSAFATLKRGYGVTKSAVDMRKRDALWLKRGYGVTKSAVDMRKLGKDTCITYTA